MTTAEKVRQQQDALTLANHVRLQCSRIKTEIAGLSQRDGCLRVAAMLDSPVDGPAGALRVGALLESVHRLGLHKSARLLRDAGVFSPQRRVRDLTGRQRRALAGLLREMAG